MEDRKAILLKACFDMLKKQLNGYGVSPFETTVHYDDADCDGYCLMDDIRVELDLP